MVTIRNIGDIYRLLTTSSSTNQIKPKRMTFDLSEDGTFYHTRIYTDVLDRNNNKTYEACIECKSDIPSLVNDFTVRYDFENKDAAIFTITIPEE